MNPEYRIFIDESGGTGINFEDINDRYLTLTGVIIKLDDYFKRINPEIDRFKEDIFGRLPGKSIILHRDEIIRKQNYFKILFDKNIQKRFDDGILTLFNELPYKVVSVSIDKHNHKKNYGYIGFEPYLYSIEVLIERYVMFLTDINSSGDVLIESRDKLKDRMLESGFRDLWKYGSPYQNSRKWQNRITSSSIKIVEKKMNENGLQLADLFAHPSRYDTLLEYKINAEQTALFGKLVCTILRENKYITNWRGGIKGCGLKLLSYEEIKNKRYLF